ncbi:MAG: hypothetical protein KF805_15180 [Phycisphaeraceae bacterium]|nr:hypothetical protein [Phycisphaeraceae bacterium]
MRHEQNLVWRNLGRARAFARGLAAGSAVAGLAFAAGAVTPTVNGVRDATYGDARAVQKVQTGFGDAAPPGDPTGSELDAAYGVIRGGRLYLMFTGNLERNFNILDVYIDSRIGGENILSNVPQYDGGYNAPAGPYRSPVLGGMRFDAGFFADYHLFARWGVEVGVNTPLEVTFVARSGGGLAQVPASRAGTVVSVSTSAVGSIPPGNVAPNASGSALTQTLFMAIINTNGLGVTAGTGAANTVAAAAVTSGFEVSISLADLGGAAAFDNIRVVAMLNGSGHDYLSNQVLPGVPAPQVNLGGDGTGVFTGSLSGVNFTTFAGTQYFTVYTCRADLNEDGVVDDADFVIFAKAYNILICSDPTMPAGCPADINEDGFVDDADFVIFVAGYNELVCP